MILAKYTHWLKENRLDELAAKNLEMAREADLPLLKLFAHLPHEKLIELAIRNLSDLLDSIGAGKGREYLKRNIQEWEENNHEYNIATHAVQPADVIYANNIQIRAIIAFIPEFTDKSEDAIAIVDDLSIYYSEAEELGLQALIRLRKKTEESFHLLVSSIQDAAIFRLDTKGYIQSWNPGAQRLKGYKEEEIVGKHFSIFYPEEEVIGGKPQRELEIVRAVGRYEEEGWRVRKDHSRFWAKVVITPIYDENGKLVGFAKLTQDLTQRLDYERSLMRKNKELSRYINETSQFARVTAHELKEPLHIISTFIKMLMEHNADTQGTDGNLIKYREIIVQKTQLMRSQLDAMQEFMSVGHTDAAPESTDLNLVLDKIKTQLSRQIEATGAQIKYGHLPIVPYSAAHMVTLFRNLVDNAIKFHKKDAVPQVEVTATSDGAEWRFSVKDNGIDIEPEHAEKIFEMFRRLHKNEGYPGIGMGLAICKKIVELNGGKIWVENQPGIGNTFVITLPIAEFPLSGDL